jgi:hypothetical protein
MPKPGAASHLRRYVSLAALTIGIAASVQAKVAEVVSVTPGGVGYVTSSAGTNGVSAEIGRWDTAYPNPDTGRQVPGLEPLGASTLRIDIDVNDGGSVSFGFQFLTYDAGIYDWLDVVMLTPNGSTSLVSRLGKPGSAYGTYWESARIALTQSLDAYKNQRVSFLFSVQQDGWGDQSSARLFSFGVRSCAVPPLTDLTDPDALRFEGGATVDTSRLNAAMQTALACLIGRAGTAGGTLTVTSAFRPPAYQAHLREVWDRWNDLKNLRTPECASLRLQAQQEFLKHGLLLSQRPAATSGHTRGEAFDARWTLPPAVSIDALALACDLTRPFPTDPVHFVHR